jgi:hypothetical protein
MQKTPKINSVQIIIIVFILITLLARRFYFKNFNNESLISFLAGVGTVLVAFLIFRLVFRNKVNK